MASVMSTAMTFITFLRNWDEKTNFYGNNWLGKHNNGVPLFMTHLMLDLPVMRVSTVYNWREGPIITRKKDGTITGKEVTAKRIRATSLRELPVARSATTGEDGIYCIAGLAAIVIILALPTDIEAAAAAEFLISTNITRNLPEVDLEAVRVTSDDPRLHIDILYTLLASGEEEAESFQVPLEAPP